jgi:hypothetical protein
VNCCAAHRSFPTLFVAIVALSAVAFFGETFAAPATVDATAVTAHVAALATRRHCRT